jgi:hypothetical protein
MSRLFFRRFARVCILFLLYITVLGDGTFRVYRYVIYPADLPVHFMVRKEALPVLDSLQKETMVCFNKARDRKTKKKPHRHLLFGQPTKVVRKMGLETPRAKGSRSIFTRA